MKQIKYFLIFLALLIVIVVATNYLNSKPKKVKENPYEYNVDEYKKVNPELISYKETRQIKVKLDDHAGLATSGENIFLASNQKVTVISVKGKVIRQFPIDIDARAVDADENSIVVAFRNSYVLYDQQGKLMQHFTINSDSSVFTSVAFWNQKIMIADAGRRRIYGFDRSKLINGPVTEFEGVSGSKNLHGFIVPSPYFEVAVNANDEFWCTNPGMHALQQYNQKGDLISSWDKASLDIDGFTGCCNPAQFAFFPDGRFVTSEKGMPRIKIHQSDGTFESVVAPPSKFENNQHAAEIATIGEIVVALDFDREMIRIFEPK